jgi:hypothetical protein
MNAALLSLVRRDRGVYCDDELKALLSNGADKDVTDAVRTLIVLFLEFLMEKCDVWPWSAGGRYKCSECLGFTIFHFSLRAHRACDVRHS